MLFRLTRFWSRLFILFLSPLLVLVVLYFIFWETINEIPDRWHLKFLNPDPVSTLSSPYDIFRLDPEPITSQHPITDLIADAEESYRRLLAKQTDSLSEAAQAYRRSRGRHPPPWFDQWHAFAEEHNCIIIEDFYDRIYSDLSPFWAIPPDQIRADSASIPNWIRIENGQASRSLDKASFMDSYFNMVQKLAALLPDLSIPINQMDEPRVLVPWAQVNESMVVLQSSLLGQDLARAPTHSNFTRLSQPAASSHVSFDGQEPYWNLARRACSPDTNIYTTEIDSDFSTSPVFPQIHPYGSHHGYVRNWTLSQDICRHPHLRNLHGTFVEPVSVSTSKSLIPIFSGSKLLVNNDILLPAAVYWSDEDRFAASKHHVRWNDKRSEVFWRGTASGGRNKANNWTRFQRHRLLSMLNGTQVAMALESANTTDTTHHHTDLPHNFPLPNNTLYPLVSTKHTLLPSWIRSFSNTAFTWLECFPPTPTYSCAYTGAWYRRGRPVSLTRMFLNKFLPDVDGNSFSGRFRAFLLSNSMPIKATIYTEWHASRLVAWKHFVPLDNTFVDLWSVLEFLFGHDDAAERIALGGREWAERVLRKEDMLVYVYRLLLEYARVCDPQREELGFGEDLAL